MPEPIRVCEFVGNMNGGGVEAVVMNYYRHIDRSKVQFDFVVTESSTIVPREEMESLGARVFTVPAYTNPPAFQKASYELFCEHSEWRIVHAHMNALNVLPLSQAARADIPVRISHSHSTAGRGEPVKNVAKNILRIFSNVYPTNRFACTQHAGYWLFGHEKPFEVVYNAIDLDRFWFNPDIRMRMRLDLGFDDGMFVIGHVGRFMPQKNQLFLIKAFTRVAASRENSVLALVGTGVGLEEAKRLVSENGLSDRVVFLGQRADVNKLYQAFDAFVLPSLYEGLGMVSIEAQASGLPCLLSDQVPQDADVTGECRYLPVEDPRAWSDVLCALNTVDDEHRAEVNRQVFANYDAEKQGAWLTDRYLQLWSDAQ